MKLIKITFDPKPGDVYDFFNSLWILNNYEYVQEVKKDLGVETNSKFDDAIEFFLKSNKFNRKKLQRYFPQEIEPNYFMDLCDLWENNTRDNYFMFIKELDKVKIRKKIIKIIMKVTNEDKNINNIDELIYENESVIKYIEDKEIDSRIKWEILCILRDSEKCIKNFIKCTKEYSENYEFLDIERKNILREFNDYIGNRIKKDSVEFLNELTNNVHKFNVYEKIYVTTSADIGLYINSRAKEKECYIIVGPRIEEILEKMSGKNELEKNMTIFRNYGDETKFKIMKLLIEREHYGIEIGEKLGLSKVNVSRHMKHLILADLVKVRRKGQKSFYFLDKDRVRNNIQFLIKELQIENFHK